ncbi:hypothetical protein AB0J01_27630 [Streptomyces sp. NPDC050204]|uniref:hypothetical protein n=1 Tax=Streptomyces sp. NPDC050204 TaxID=3155514 RepID=UPI00343478EE
MNDTTSLAIEPTDDEETPPPVAETLERLARTYVRTGALPLPRNPATFGWQVTAGGLAALAAQLLHYVDTVDPERAAAFADFYHGHLGDGPHPLAVGWWIQKNLAEPAGADMGQWAAEAETEAEAAFAYTSRPTGLADLGVLLGDDVLSLLINGLGASWKEWEEHGSTRRTCFLPGCFHEFDISQAWSGAGGMHGEGWMCAPAVGFACSEHATYLWAGDHQHVPTWTTTGPESSPQLSCTCGWASGKARFRGYGIALYQAHALDVVEPEA